MQLSNIIKPIITSFISQDQITPATSFNYKNFISQNSQETSGDIVQGNYKENSLQNKENETKNDDARFEKIKTASDNIVLMMNNGYEAAEEYIQLVFESERRMRVIRSNDKAFSENNRKYYENQFSVEYFESVIEKLDIKDLTSEDKELCKGILKDKYILEDEVKNLSFKELQTLDKFYMKAQDGIYVGESIYVTDVKAGALLQAVNATKDEVFNETIFDAVQSMDDDQQIAIYMAIVTGGRGFGRESAYHDITKDSPSSPGKEPSLVLEQLIKDTKNKLDNAATDQDKNFYKNMLEIYNDLSLRYEQKLSGKESGQIIEEEIEADIMLLYKMLLSISNIELTSVENEIMDKILLYLGERTDESARENNSLLSQYTKNNKPNLLENIS